MNIIELAEQAGLAYKTTNGKYWIDAGYPDIHLERFAELVAAAEREACAKQYLAIMRDSVSEARASERESCAELCEKLLTEPMLAGWNGFQHYMTQCAQRIRARGDKHD